MIPNSTTLVTSKDPNDWIERLVEEHYDSSISKIREVLQENPFACLDSLALAINQKSGHREVNYLENILKLFSTPNKDEFHSELKIILAELSLDGKFEFLFQLLYVAQIRGSQTLEHLFENLIIGNLEDEAHHSLHYLHPMEIALRYILTVCKAKICSLDSIRKKAESKLCSYVKNQLRNQQNRQNLEIIFLLACKHKLNLVADQCLDMFLSQMSIFDVWDFFNENYVKSWNLSNLFSDMKLIRSDFEEKKEFCDEARKLFYQVISFNPDPRLNFIEFKSIEQKKEAIQSTRQLDIKFRKAKRLFPNLSAEQIEELLKTNNAINMLVFPGQQIDWDFADDPLFITQLCTKKDLSKNDVIKAIADAPSRPDEVIWVKQLRVIAHILNFSERLGNEDRENHIHLIVSEIIFETLLTSEALTSSQYVLEEDHKSYQFGKKVPKNLLPLYRIIAVYTTALIYRVEPLIDYAAKEFISRLDQLESKPKSLKSYEECRDLLKLTVELSKYPLLERVFNIFMKNHYWLNNLLMELENLKRTEKYPRFIQLLNRVNLGELNHIDQQILKMTRLFFPYSSIKFESMSLDSKFLDGIEIAFAKPTILDKPPVDSAKEEPQVEEGRPALKSVTLKHVSTKQGIIARFLGFVQRFGINLERLDLEANGLQEADFQKILSLLESTKTLSFLKICREVFSTHSFDKLCHGLSMNHSLKVIKMSHCGITDSQANRLLSSLTTINSPTLEYLDLGYNKLGISALKLVEVFKTHPSIRVVSLEHNQLVDQNVTDLANEVIRLRHVVKINFSSPKLNLPALFNSINSVSLCDGLTLKLEDQKVKDELLKLAKKVGKVGAVILIGACILAFTGLISVLYSQVDPDDLERIDRIFEMIDYIL